MGRITNAKDWWLCWPLVNVYVLVNYRQANATTPTEARSKIGVNYARIDGPFDSKAQAQRYYAQEIKKLQLRKEA